MNAFTTSTAVMARRVEPADSLDYFPTPPWATRAFCEHVLPAVWRWPDQFAGTACDPACGEGHMAAVLGEYFDNVAASDIYDYGYGRQADFLHPDWPRLSGIADPAWIITNPPFNRAAEFIDLALSRAKRGVAILARTTLQEGEERYDTLFKHRPPQLVAQFVERCSMVKGRWAINARSATAYQWFVWLRHPPHDWLHTRLIWIPKSKITLRRHDDWLRFGGCSDLAATHPIVKMIEAQGRRHAVSIEAVRANMTMDAPSPATIGDVRKHMEALL
jgi:hypothetical protein